MVRSLSLLAVLAILTVSGCGQSASVPTMVQAAEPLKRLVSEFVVDAKKTPKSAPDKLVVLRETLASAAKTHAGPFAALNQAAEQLQQSYQSNDKKSVEDKLQAFDAAAKALP